MVISGGSGGVRNNLTCVLNPLISSSSSLLSPTDDDNDKDDDDLSDVFSDPLARVPLR